MSKTPDQIRKEAGLRWNDIRKYIKPKKGELRKIQKAAKRQGPLAGWCSKCACWRLCVVSRTYRQISKTSRQQINERPPEMCAGCGQAVDMNGCEWVVLANQKVIHHGGSKGDTCYRKLNARTVE